MADETSAITFGSLFAGVGGFDLGLEAAGWRCGWQVEWDSHCQQVLAHHWPDVPRWSDVCDVDGKELPPVDVITFGSPCQDLSVAGKRAGLEGNRSGLFFEATRIIKEMQDATGGTFPRCVIWENVVGALSSKNGDDFAAVLEEMVDLGCHHLEWSVLDAQFFGVPQRRRRVFVIGILDHSAAQRSGQQILSVGQGRRRNTSQSKAPRQNPAGAFASGFGNSGYERWSERNEAVTLSQRDYKFPNNIVVDQMDSLIVGSLQARDYKGVGNQYVMENKLVVHDSLPNTKPE